MLKILAIDDDFIVLATLGALVKNHLLNINSSSGEGLINEVYSIDVAPSIETAHEFLEKSDKCNIHYDIIFLDLSINTKNDGFTLIPVIKKMFPKTFVVIISANREIETLKAVGSMGVSGYVKKPISNQSKRITEVLDRVLHFNRIAGEMGYDKK